MKVKVLNIRFGKHLRTFREEHGWTQQDLADKLSMERTALSRIETGKSGVLLSTLLNWALVLGVEPQDMTPGTAFLKDCEL